MPKGHLSREINLRAHQNPDPDPGPPASRESLSMDPRDIVDQLQRISYGDDFATRLVR